MADVKQPQPVQRTKFDLDSFSEVTVYHEREVAPEITSIEQALALVANDSAKLFAVIREGLNAEIGRRIGDSADGWYTKDESGTQAPFTGTLGSIKVKNDMVLNLAKTVSDPPWSQDMTPEQKATCKAEAEAFIRAQPKMMAGLRKRCIDALKEEEG